MAGNARTVVFVDLDGTLLLTNSYHWFVEALWRQSDPICRGRILLALGRRKLMRGQRARLAAKWALIDFALSLHPDAQLALVNDITHRLSHLYSPTIVALLSNESSRGSAIVLATAAPSLYAHRIADSIGMDDCLATDAHNVDREELFGVAKAKACREYIDSQGPFDNVIVLTDHVDDIPLMRLATQVVVQSAPTMWREISVQLSGIPITWLDVEGPQEDGGMWAWIAGTFYGPLTEWDLRMTLSKHRYALLYTGNSRWRRLAPGGSFGDGCRRLDPPMAPGFGARTWIAIRRGLVRDRLGVYH